jgi:hypothetical protein
MRDQQVRCGALALGLALAACCGGPRADEKPAKPAPDPTPKTVVYEVGDLLHRPGGWSGFDSLDEVSRAVIDATGAKHWDPEARGAWTLRELDGVRLEITAPAKGHEEVRDLLANLRGRNDVAVVMNADLIEVDAAYYDKTLRPLLAAGRRGPDGPAVVGHLRQHAVSEELEQALRKKGAVVRSTRTTLANGRDGVYLSLRQVFSYVRTPAAPGGKVPDEYATAATGLELRATGTVSPDRQFVRLKLTEQGTDLLGFETKPGFRGEEEIEVRVPDLAETTASQTVNKVADGVTLLVTVQHLPKATKEKGRVLVLLVQPSIFIREEEKARGNNPKP